MVFHFYSPSHFEPWDYKNPLEKGIGGSETAHIEMAIRLAKRGHEVYSYSPLPDGVKPDQLYRGVIWYDLDHANFKNKGIWVLGRCPQVADKFDKDHPGQKLWLVMQDTAYPKLTKQRALKLDVLFPLCEKHVIVTENNHPEVKDRIIKSANGIRTDVISKLAPQERDPFRIMYASSPDRGLVTLLQIFPRILEREPRANLHVFYGLDNIMKVSDRESPIDNLGNTVEDLLALSRQPNVFWHGRIGQLELYSEWLKTGVWAYPTRFSETSCITSMESQALGAIPVTNPFWALDDNVMSGSLIDGDPGVDRLTQNRYIDEIIYWMNVKEKEKPKEGFIKYTRTTDFPRYEMMEKAQERFDWEKVVDQYEQLAKI